MTHVCHFLRTAPYLLFCQQSPTGTCVPANCEVRTFRDFLFLAKRVKIRRHVKIEGNADPYDPAWELYFEERLA